MLSSKPPPYDTALVAEARESAGKIEGGFWTKSSSAADYESRARKKLETISGQIQRSGTPGETQRSHYHAAMIAQGSLGYEDAARAANEDAVARAPPTQDNAQLAATLDLFDRKLQSSGAGPSQASQASQASSPRPATDPALHRIVQAIVKRYVDRAEFKAFLQPLSIDQRRAYLVKIAQCGKRALGQYYQQQKASGSKSKGLGEVALVEHITGVVMKVMAKADGSGAGAAGIGLHHHQQLRQREEEARRVAAAREKLERERAEHERARRDGAVGGSNPGGGRVGAPPVGGVMEMAAYWTRLGLMRGAYLPRAKQTMDLLKKKARHSAQRQNAERFLQWMSEYLVPMLSQTAEAPCASAKFSMDELERLDAQMKKLVAMTSGRGAAMTSGSAAGGGVGNSDARAGGGPAASGGAAESSFTSESADAPNASLERSLKRDPESPVFERDHRRALAEKEARDEEAQRKAAEALSARPSAFARVVAGDGAAAASPPPAPWALERFPPPQTPGKPSEVSGEDTAAPAIFVDPARANKAVAMRFVNGGRELIRLALETKANAGDATPASVWKSWDDLVK